MVRRGHADRAALDGAGGDADAGPRPHPPARNAITGAGLCAPRLERLGSRSRWQPARRSTAMAAGRLGAARTERRRRRLNSVRDWLKRRREQRTLERRAIPDPLWQLTLARFPFLSWRTASEVSQLRDMATLFLADKEFTGTHGLQV